MAPAVELHERYEELVRLIAHDLRNPLTAVQLNGQLIELEAAQNGREKPRRWARLVVEAARRMDDLVGKLVEAERIRSGRIQLTRETVVLGRLLPDVVAGLGPEAGKWRMVTPPEDTAVSADRARLVQVFAVLLRLAGQEAEPGAEIAVELGARAGMVGCSIRAPRAAQPSDGGTPAGANPPDRAGHSILEHFARTVIECHGGTLHADGGSGPAFAYDVALPANPP